MNKPSDNQVSFPILIRAEQPEDIPAIATVNRAVFGNDKTANLIDALRDEAALALSLVAVRDGQIVGHVSFSPLAITHADVAVEVIGLAPLSVLPECQRQGIGNALVREGLQRLRESGWKIVIVLGNPHYYGRFGFEAASKHGISWKARDAGNAFQVMELCPVALASVRGLADYHPAFARTGCS